jgi:hypothetical protein
MHLLQLHNREKTKTKIQRTSNDQSYSKSAESPAPRACFNIPARGSHDQCKSLKAATAWHQD